LILALWGYKVPLLIRWAFQEIENVIDRGQQIENVSAAVAKALQSSAGILLVSEVEKSFLIGSK
jgi:hypothetical protein